MKWTEVEDQIIIDNRGTKSAAQIADMIGHGLTRNAILGRIHHLGLPKIKHAVTGGPRRPRAARIKYVKARPPQREFPSPPVAVQPLNIPFLDLAPHHCREIVGSQGFGMSLSCGHPRIEGSGFCRWHHSINYTRPDPRKETYYRTAA